MTRKSFPKRRNVTNEPISISKLGCSPHHETNQILERQRGVIFGFFEERYEAKLEVVKGMETVLVYYHLDDISAFLGEVGLIDDFFIKSLDEIAISDYVGRESFVRNLEFKPAVYNEVVKFISGKS